MEVILGTLNYLGALALLLRSWYIYKALLFLDNRKANVFNFIWRFALDPIAIFIKLDREKSTDFTYQKYFDIVKILSQIAIAIIALILILFI